jgi:hypothetical protein
VAIGSCQSSAAVEARGLVGVPVSRLTGLRLDRPAKHCAGYRIADRFEIADHVFPLRGATLCALGRSC